MAFGIDDAISGAGGILGGIFGGLFGNSDKQKAKQLQEQALKGIQGVSLPSIEELQLHLEDLKSQGKLTPEMEQSILQQASEMGAVQTDPRLKDAQMSALARMQQTGNEGLTAQDRLRLNDTRRGVAQDAQARDQAILQSMGERGAGGSGSELAARMISSQAQADRAARGGDEIAAQANAQALQALMNAGTLGGQMQSQEFNQKSAQAQAQDAINRFNAANQQSVMSTNTAARNNAQLQNLNSAQRISDSNVGTHNAQQGANKQVLADDYARRMQKAQTEAQALNNQANTLTGSANQTAQSWASIGSGVGKAAAGAFGGAAKVAPDATAEDQNKLAQKMRRE